MISESDIREGETAKSGRAANGRFEFGNPGGPGNPFGGRAAAARRILMDRITEEELTAIWEQVIAMAKDGHWQAIKLVLSYVFGKPGKMPDLEDLDPSPNGVFSAPSAATPSPPVAEPSPNGVFSAPPPDAPSPPAVAPSPNGVFSPPPAVAPSPNGVFSAPRNRKERRALRKAQRIAERQALRGPASASA